MKKILTTIALGSTLLTSSLMASDSYKTTVDKELIQMVKNGAEEAYKSRTNPVDLRVKQNVCPTIMGRYGVGMNITIKSPSSGVNYTYDVNSFCFQVDSYIEHINNRYEEEDNIELLYEFAGFITRIPQKHGYSDIEGQDNDFIKNFLIGSNIVDTIRSYKDNFISYRIAARMFRDGYQGSEKNVGFNDPQFHKWLGYVLSKNFNDADKVIEKNMNGEMLRYRTIKQNQTMYYTEKPDFVKIFYKNGFSFYNASANEVNEYLCESTNNSQSCFNSGATYYNGINGVQNYIRGEELIRKSCDLGNQNGCNAVKHFFTN